MRWWMLVGFLGGVAACNGSSSSGYCPIALQERKCPSDWLDGSVPDTSHGCDALAGSGCLAGQKCTALLEQGVAVTDCVPDGTVDLGGTCVFREVNQVGDFRYDDCTQGGYCWNAICEQICDPLGGSPVCASGFTCVTHDGVFAPLGQPELAGLCEPM